MIGVFVFGIFNFFQRGRLCGVFFCVAELLRLFFSRRRSPSKQLMMPLPRQPAPRRRHRQRRPLPVEGRCCWPSCAPSLRRLLRITTRRPPILCCQLRFYYRVFFNVSTLQNCWPNALCACRRRPETSTTQPRQLSRSRTSQNKRERQDVGAAAAAQQNRKQLAARTLDHLKKNNLP